MSGVAQFYASKPEPDALEMLDGDRGLCPITYDRLMSLPNAKE